MTERHTLSEFEQPVGRIDRRNRDPESLGRAQQEQRIPDRFGRRHQQLTPCVFGQRLEPPDITLLDSTGERRCLRHPEPTGQLRRRHPSGQVDQGKRIAARLGDDPVTHRLIEHRRDLRCEQRAGIAVAQALDLKLRQVRQLLSRLTRREHDRDGFCQQAPGHERER